MEQHTESGRAECQRLAKIVHDLLSQQAKHLHEQQLLWVGLQDIEKSLTNIWQGASPELNIERFTQREYQSIMSPVNDEDGEALESTLDQQEPEPMSPPISTRCEKAAMEAFKANRQTTFFERPRGKRRVGFAWAATIANHNIFASLTSLSILLNAMFMAMASEDYMQRVIDSWNRALYHENASHGLREPPVWMLPTEVAFSVVFTFELTIRLLAEGPSFLYGENNGWNALDSVCVFSAYFDLSLTFFSEAGFSFNFLRILRFAKALRVLRLIRALRFLSDLSVMLKTVYKSFSALCSALVALCGMIFIVDLLLLQFLAENILSSKGGDAQVIAAIGDFGSFSQICLTLWSAVFDDWRIFYDRLEAIAPALAVFFLISNIMMILGPLNIITGIFVQQAHHNLQADWDFAKQHQRDKTRKKVGMLSQLFFELDKDESGAIQWDEWISYTERAEAQDAFQAVGLEIDKFKSDDFFELIDSDGNGMISHEEFVLGCITGLSGQQLVDEVTLRRSLKELSKGFDESMARHVSTVKAHFVATLERIEFMIINSKLAEDLKRNGRAQPFVPLYREFSL